VNIEVSLTGPSDAHCFKITFQAQLTPDTDERKPLVIYLHTTQALDLFSQIGAKLAEYFHSASEELLEIRSRALEV
jgi:hypothetical protein